MHLPRLDDTIVAVSTAWTPSPAAIVRLSGPAAVTLVESVSEPGAALQARYPQCKTATIRVDDSLRVPARVYAFRGPQSYTGQDLSEIHTVGCLPVVRALATRLIELGARPALPGEFTSRAFLLGKLDAGEVDRVLGLIHAADAAAARQATRAAAGSLRGRIEALGAEIADTLAAIEAGIDFVDEEDVRFITDEQVVERLSHLMARLDGMTRASLSSRDGRVPHVALAGLPNAGKSTLFNTLIGRDRAIVSPVLGTTRDVLCAETNAGRVRIVLQDCAGLGASVDELERAAHVAAEQAAEQADLVLWVHDGSQPWQASESAACERFPVQRRILVVSQSDRAGFQSGLDPPIPFAGRVEVSSASGSGIDELRGIIERHLDQGLGEAGVTLLEEDFHAVRTRLEQALTVARAAGTSAAPELVSLELRSAWDRLSQAGQGPVVEEVLGRIFTRFCIGK